MSKQTVAGKHAGGKHASWTDNDDEQAALQRALEENIRLGRIEVKGKNKRGETIYRLTPAGKKYADEMVRSNPEARKLREDLKLRGMK